MNAIRDAVHLLVSYPYSLIRRFTSTTWSLLWTRGLVNYMPFIRKQPIKDSMNRVEVNPSPAQAIPIVADAQGLKGSVKSDETVDISLGTATESSQLSINLDASSTDTKDTSKGHDGQDENQILEDSIKIDMPRLDLENRNLLEPDSVKIVQQTKEGEESESKLESVKIEKDDATEFVPHIHLAAKRNSTTMEEEIFTPFIVSEKDFQFNESSKLDEVLISPTLKKPKLELEFIPPRQRQYSSDDSSKKKSHEHVTLVTPNLSKAKMKRSQQRSRTNSRSSIGDGQGGVPEINHFFAVQMSNPKIHLKLEELQSKMLEKELTHASFKKFKTGDIFSSTMVQIKKSHVTLHVCHLKDDEQIETAKTAMQKIWEKYKSDFEKDSMRLEVQGLGHFKNSVLFAKVVGEPIEKLKTISDELKDEFRALNIYGDETKPFKPHLTIAKLSKANKDRRFKKHNIRSFPREFWLDFESTHFGYQSVEGIQLLKMKGDPQTGYYEIVETYPFTLEETKEKTSTEEEGSEKNENNN